MCLSHSTASHQWGPLPCLIATLTVTYVTFLFGLHGQVKQSLWHVKAISRKIAFWMFARFKCGVSEIYFIFNSKNSILLRLLKIESKILLCLYVWNLYCRAFSKKTITGIPQHYLMCLFVSLLVCVQGYYGNNCREECGVGCQSSTCDSQTGNCTCSSLWQPPLCQGNISDEIES